MVNKIINYVLTCRYINNQEVHIEFSDILRMAVFAYTYMYVFSSLHCTTFGQAKREEYDLGNATHVEHGDNLETSSLTLGFVAIDKVSGCASSLSIDANHHGRLKLSAVCLSPFAGDTRLATVRR